MLTSTNRTVTSHAGSLPRPDDLLAMNRARQAGQPYDEAARLVRLPGAVRDVVRRQVEAGLDSVNDGELSKFNFLQYVQERLGGFQLEDPGRGFFSRRDWEAFEDFYRELRQFGPEQRQPVCVGPITYTGFGLLRRDLDNFKAAMEGVQAEGFMTALAPATFAMRTDRYYKTHEEFMFAMGEAMREEYKAIVDAGWLLQLDDPGLVTAWDATNPEPPLAEFRRLCEIRVAALNNALRDLPAERIRYHLCWGSWHGPHTTDIPLRDIVDVMLKVKAGCFSLEAGNVRHEHDWKVWRETKLPDGVSLMPGVVSHATNVVEHPELVADRIVQYAEVVGRENVIAGTDCGMGGRVHPQIAWAKLRALSEGAALASRELWKT